MPLVQSEFFVHCAVWHVPPQVLPEPQSAFVAHALALHFEPVQVPPVPQSEADPHDEGGVQWALLQSPSGQPLSLLQMAVLHLAPLQV